MSEIESEKNKFTILAEWTIRKLRKINTDVSEEDELIRWILYSFGIEKIGQDIYLYLRKEGSSTSTEIAEKFGISPATARRYLEQLHLIGLVDYIGREYHLSFEDISRGIRSILIPRINEVLHAIIMVANKVSGHKYLEEPFTSEASFSTWEHLAEKIEKKIWKGIKIKESEDKIIMDVFRKYELTMGDINRCLDKGKKLVIRVFGSLKISRDIDPTTASQVIDRVTVFGSVEGPKNVLNAILDRFEIFGSLRMR